MFTLRLLLFALSSSFLQANLDLEENPTEDSIKFFEDDQFSMQSTTTESTTIEAYKLTVSITDNNVSREFKPSLHLGEIKESRISPFNNLHHIRFDNEVDPVSYHQVNNLGVVYQPEYPTQVHQVSLQGISEASDEDRRQVHVKFQDYPANVPKVYYGDLVQNQGYQLAGNVGYDLVDQQVFQNVEKPDQNSNYKLGKPSKQEFQGFSNDPRMQYGYQDQAYEGLNAIRKPFDGAVYVQEASFVRTKKFPYPLLQPPVGYQEIEQHSSYPVRERVSPWKKILHLIGAFLPIGLLVAALTPSIVKVNNTTDPNIVLSKWRVADLPVEHKQARFSDSSIICEERSICDVILAGGEAGSNALQNILWNIATRTSTTIAKECGLQEIFEAVKKKDCTTIVC